MALTKKRDVSVDILKFFAVFIIMNSHMDGLYTHYKFLATGGAIGDVLFLFLSGYTLFLGRRQNFSDYYKRRISRIYPSLIAFCCMMWLLCQMKIKDSVNFFAYSFVNAIMVYYVILYFIRDHLESVKWLFLLDATITLMVYIFWFPYKFEVSSRGMYGITTSFRWIPYFGFMLLGSYIGAKHENMRFNIRKDLIKLIFCLVLFYGIQLAAKLYRPMAPLQIITLIPLAGIVYYAYKACNAKCLIGLYQKKYFHGIIMTVSGLCLEAYIVQFGLLTDKLNFLFPLNIPIIMCIILFVAFIIKCLGKLLLQTFRTENYQWKEIIRPY
ncbi:MAG: acyltransferase [Prevotella sp.]|jgi:hypothetical protein|nr:acyltransferase [Prevotella sp.]